MDTYDLIVIGGGPAGYQAALRARQLDLSCLVVEAERPGGLCLNWGCIPSKSLLSSAELIEDSRRAARFGLRVSPFTGDPSTPPRLVRYAHSLGVAQDSAPVGLRYDLAQIRSREVVDRIAEGLNGLLRKKGVIVVQGNGRLDGPGRVVIRPEAGEESLVKAQWIMLATGTVPRALSGIPIDRRYVWTSQEALAETQLPSHVAIIGAGAVGVEFASLWQSFGTRVHLLEAADRILPGMDPDLSNGLQRILHKRGMAIQTQVKIENIRREKGQIEVSLHQPQQPQSHISATGLLVAIGREGRVEGLCLESCGITLEKGFIPVNERFETRAAGIYAAGDVTGVPHLAHRAAAQGIAAVHAMTGKPSRMTPDHEIPACVYSHPELSAVGWTEEQARQKHELSVGKIFFRANGRAVASGLEEGMVKVLVDRKNGMLLGAHIMGPCASEMISLAAMLMSLKIPADRLRDVVVPHPTYTETLAEAIGQATA